MSRKKLIGIIFIVAVMAFCFTLGPSIARNLWYLPDENKGSFQLHTLRTKAIRAPQVPGNETLTIYSPALSGTITNSATVSGGTYSSPTITGGTISSSTIDGASNTIKDTEVYIDSIGELSSDINGNSIYQMAAGKKYYVDFDAIQKSNWTGTIATVTGYPASGLTFYQPQATSTTNGQTTEILRVDSYGGVSVVYVAPYPYLTGATSFTQNMGRAVSGTSVVSVGTANDTELNRIGAKKSWRLDYAAAVSAWPLDHLHTAEVGGTGSGDIVTTTGTQTLTNKTVSGGTFSGSITATNATVSGGTFAGVTVTGSTGVTNATLMGPTISGATVTGVFTLSGATRTNVKEDIAYLGGTTGTISWNYCSASGVSPSLTTQSGESGWFLSSANMKQYSTFIVDPSGGTGGASPYTHACPQGIASSGATVQLTGLLTEDLHGMTWTFTNATGTTAFVLYDENGRFNGTSGVTENYTPAAARAPEDQGDTVQIQAIYRPTSVSGWYVRNIKNFD